MKINRERRGIILNKRKDYNRNKIGFNKIFMRLKIYA
jgi:hypothetical protein